MGRWSEEYKKQRSLLMKQKWSDPQYRKSQMASQKGKIAWNKGINEVMDCHYKITFGHEKPKDILVWGHNLSHVIQKEC